jgi:hypothetical protein
MPRHPLLTSVIAWLVGDRTDPDALLIEPDTLAPEASGVRGDAFGKRFGRLKRGLGFDKRYNFHSTRRTFVFMCEHSGLDEAQAARLVSHAAANRLGFTYKRYSQADIGRLAEGIAALKVHSALVSAIQKRFPDYDDGEKILAQNEGREKLLAELEKLNPE